MIPAYIISLSLYIFVITQMKHANYILETSETFRSNLLKLKIRKEIGKKRFAEKSDRILMSNFLFFIKSVFAR